MATAPGAVLVTHQGRPPAQVAVQAWRRCRPEVKGKEQAAPREGESAVVRQEEGEGPTGPWGGARPGPLAELLPGSSRHCHPSSLKKASKSALLQSDHFFFGLHLP